MVAATLLPESSSYQNPIPSAPVEPVEASVVEPPVVVQQDRLRVIVQDSNSAQTPLIEREKHNMDGLGR